MEKQVKVNVSWNGSSVRLTTDRGMEYEFAPVVPEIPIRPVALAIEEKSITPIRKR